MAWKPIIYCMLICAVFLLVLKHALFGSNGKGRSSSEEMLFFAGVGCVIAAGVVTLGGAIRRGERR